MGSMRQTRETPTQTSRTSLHEAEHGEVEQLRAEIAQLKEEIKARRAEEQTLEPYNYSSIDDIVPRGEQYALAQISQQVCELRSQLHVKRHGKPCLSYGGDASACSDAQDDFSNPMTLGRLQQLHRHVQEESSSRLRFEDSVRCLDQCLEASGEHLPSVLQMNQGLPW